MRQTEQGRVNPSLHVHKLKCSGGQCALTTITLNSCRYFPVTRGPAWPLIIERAETTNGSLHVTNQGNTLIVEDKGSDIGGDYTTTQRFQYERPTDGRPVNRIIAYSGGLIKNSAVANQVIVIQYVPLPSRYQEVTLDCPLALPGLDPF